MALSRIGNPTNLSILSRFKHGGIPPLGEIHYTNQNRIESLHISRVNRYPAAPTLSLPNNVSEIFANETGRFTPERARDITTPVLIHSCGNQQKISSGTTGSKAFFDSNWNRTIHQDSHVDSYDCFGAVSLYSSMQTNVPKPFNSTGKSTYLNMPGGQWARDEKYIAEDMQKSQYTVKSQLLKDKKNGSVSNLAFMNLLFPLYNTNARNYSTTSSAKEKPKEDSRTESAKTVRPKLTLTRKEMLTIMVKDYGKTIIVFHIGISLISLGVCYYLISSGIDMTPFINKAVGVDSEYVAEIMLKSSTFAIAYGIHKLMAPIRLLTTMAFAPILVQFLRRKGILKHPEIVKKIKEARLKASQTN